MNTYVHEVYITIMHCVNTVIHKNSKIFDPIYHRQYSICTLFKANIRNTIHAVYIML